MAQFESLESGQRNQFVGNSIFGTIAQAFGQADAPRLTGMLLDEKVIDLKQLVTDNNYFNTKVQEAFSLLAQSRQQQQQ